MRRVCALRHQGGAQYSAVEEIRNKAAVRNVLPPAPYPEPAGRFNTETLAWIFFAQCLNVMAVRERSVQFHTEIGRHWAKR